MKNAFSIDFEDWYQGLEIPCEMWAGYERRLQDSGRRLLDLLAEAGVRGTFFILGRAAEEHPDLVRRIASDGHEIATHGYSHTLVYELPPDQFRSELRRSVDLLQELTGREVKGHRAPFFSIRKDSLWALEILREEGLSYDSSIFPVRNYRYGIPDAPRLPYRHSTAGGSILEFPMTTWEVGGRRLPVAGGAYFRIFPYFLTRAGLRSVNRQGQAAIFYLHPWELDPGHPRIPLPRRIAATHYFNLAGTETRLIRLLREFQFAPVAEVLEELNLAC